MQACEPVPAKRERRQRQLTRGEDAERESTAQERRKQREIEEVPEAEPDCRAGGELHVTAAHPAHRKRAEAGEHDESAARQVKKDLLRPETGEDGAGKKRQRQ